MSLVPHSACLGENVLLQVADSHALGLDYCLLTCEILELFDMQLWHLPAS
jgi:hypothetical protein